MSETDEQLALTRAKLQLMKKKNTLFYTTILFSLEQIFEAVGTACTNGKYLKIDPVWFLTLSDNARIGLLCHELLHVALNHMCRRGKRHPRVWNEAADHVINLTLIAAGYELPKGGLWDQRFKYMSTEEVYALLWEEYEQAGIDPDGLQIPGGQDVIYPGEGESDGESNEEQQAKIDQHSKQVAALVQKACIAATGTSQMPGFLPGEVQIMLEMVLDPKLPWWSILENYMTGYAKDDYTWSRPNRRYMNVMYLPTAYSEAVGEIVTAFDLSGSVSPSEISYFVRETSAIMKQLKPEKITVIGFDEEISSIDTLTADSDIFNELKLKGQGGTDVTELLQWAIDNDPTVLLIFTDGYFNWPSGLKPGCDIIWLIHENPGFTAPFGEVIHYNIKDR